MNLRLVNRLDKYPDTQAYADRAQSLFTLKVQPATLVDNLRDANFDAEHEGFYLAFKAEAYRLWLGEGRTHGSARSIIHHLRDDTPVADGGKPWKVNNVHSPYLARRLIREDGRFTCWFELRKSIADQEEGK